jgi:hypothetical protein
MRHTPIIPAASMPTGAVLRCCGCDAERETTLAREWCNDCAEMTFSFLDDSQCDYIEARMHDGFRALYRGELGFAPVVRTASGVISAGDEL